MAFGEILKAAREQRGLSLSSVAESTHMKVQVIEDLEREDFHRIAAPIYGRGFVKLYAEFLELDPAPLIREFMDAYTGRRPPVVGRRHVETEPDIPAAADIATPITRTVSDAALQRPEAPPRPAVRPIENDEPPPPPSTDFDDDDDRELAHTHDDAPLPPAPAFPLPYAGRRTPDAGRPDDMLVLEPEHQFSGLTGDPELFTPAPPPPKPLPRKTAKKPRGPIFDMGRHLNTDPASEAEADSDPSTQRNHARMSAFIEGCKRLKTTALGGAFPVVNAKYKNLFIVAGAALLVFVLLGFGLLKLTTPKQSHPGPAPRIFETIAPIPDLYVN